MPVHRERPSRFTVASTTSRKRAPGPLRSLSYQSSASAISSAASGWNFDADAHRWRRLPATRSTTWSQSTVETVPEETCSERASSSSLHAWSTAAGSSKLSSSSRLASQIYSECGALVHRKGQQLLAQGHRSRVHRIRPVRRWPLPMRELPPNRSGIVGWVAARVRADSGRVAAALRRVIMRCQITSRRSHTPHDMWVGHRRNWLSEVFAQVGVCVSCRRRRLMPASNAWPTD